VTSIREPLSPSDQLADPIWAIGRFHTSAGLELWPSRASERIAASNTATDVLSSHGVESGASIALVSLLAEAVQFVPIADAIERLAAVPMPVDATGRDAGRLASFMTQFTLAAVIGVGGDTVTELKGIEAAVEHLGNVPLVFARSDTHQELRSAGLNPYAVDIVGPTLALECCERAGGHLLGLWVPAAEDGSIVLRSESHSSVHTDVAAEIRTEACGCGIDSSRLVIQ
jgi:hypothetical protein